jgi:hypothetical protein
VTSGASQNRAPVKAPSKRSQEFLQKVSAQLEASKSALQVVSNSKAPGFHNQPSRFMVWGFCFARLRRLELTRALVHFDHVAFPRATIFVVRSAHEDGGNRCPPDQQIRVG